MFALLWSRNRDEWVRYVRRFATVIFVVCTMFVLVPTAPPWMAAGNSPEPEFRFDARRVFWPKVRSTWLRAELAAYPAVMAVALVYFGEHYLTDALVGWAVVGLSFLLWNRIEENVTTDIGAAQVRTASDRSAEDNTGDGIIPVL